MNYKYLSPDMRHSWHVIVTLSSTIMSLGN